MLRLPCGALLCSRSRSHLTPPVRGHTRHTSPLLATSPTICCPIHRRGPRHASPAQRASLSSAPMPVSTNAKHALTGAPSFTLLYLESALLYMPQTKHSTDPLYVWTYGNGTGRERSLPIHTDTHSVCMGHTLPYTRTQHTLDHTPRHRVPGTVVTKRCRDGAAQSTPHAHADTSRPAPAWQPVAIQVRHTLGHPRASAPWADEGRSPPRQITTSPDPHLGRSPPRQITTSADHDLGRSRPRQIPTSADPPHLGMAILSELPRTSLPLAPSRKSLLSRASPSLMRSACAFGSLPLLSP
jgi:hypothetical protein